MIVSFSDSFHVTVSSLLVHFSLIDITISAHIHSYSSNLVMNKAYFLWLPWK